MTPDQFHQSYTPEPNSGCWLWLGAMRGAYGAVWWGRKATGAHRASWEINVGPIPEGMLVCHKCDNPYCVNPGHLFLGTPADNSLDMRIKRRSAMGDRNASRRPEVAAKRRGELNGNSKLAAATVVAIYESPLSQKKAAATFGVAQSWVQRIRRREVWKHVLPSAALKPMPPCGEPSERTAPSGSASSTRK